jgi:hypothetical protein
MDQMREKVAEAFRTQTVAELLPLLDEPPVNQWLAFQLLDLGKPEKPVVERCLAIIEGLAAGSGPTALGSQIWLREWSTKAKRAS